MATSARTILIGDVHGCLDELEELRRTLSISGDDRVILVGDLVAKGPDSAGVIAWARAHRAESVLGNHDEVLLRYDEARREDRRADDAPEAVRKTARKLDDADWAWLQSLPLLIAIPDHHALAVHAGLVPGVPLAAQRREDMLTMRSIRADGTATKKLEDGVPWASLWTGPEHVYFGHDAVRGLQRHLHATGLDTGCVYGGRLTAFTLPDRELVSVKARRAYAEPGKTLAARQVIGQKKREGR
jgi:hypothetical protein